MADAAARSFARDCNAAAATVVALSTAYGYGGSSNDAACAAAAQGAAVEFAPSFNVSEVTSDPSCQISNATFDGFAAIATCEAYAANLTAFCGIAARCFAASGGTVAADGVGDDRRAALRTHKPTHRSAPVRKQQEREPSPVRQHRTAPMLQVLMTPRDRLTGSDEEARRERERFLQNQHTGWR